MVADIVETHSGFTVDRSLQASRPVCGLRPSCTHPRWREESGQASVPALPAMGSDIHYLHRVQTFAVFWLPVFSEQLFFDSVLLKYALHTVKCVDPMCPV